jgi:hypothetical protein
MPWKYEQSTGRMYQDEALVQGNGGYSGKGQYKNTPNAQGLSDNGPIPRGKWTIGGYTNSKGPMTITLTPKPDTQTFGRSAFRIHGDSIANPGTASEGCIIMNATTRHMIINSGDTELEVVQ